MTQRIIVAMMDGFGLPYFQQEVTPCLHEMSQKGFYKTVRGMFPSVTNVNNVSIATGAWPVEHGISANSRFDPETGKAEYLNNGILCGSVFTRAKQHGVKTGLLTSKRKTAELFRGHADFVLAAEALDPEQTAKYGEAPGIYSAEINHWLWRTAETIVDSDPGIGLLYVHITDYPMHAWAPNRAESVAHLAGIDRVLSSIMAKHPDIAFFATADHGMNYKTQSYDLTRWLAARGLPVRFVLSPERDYYVVHHKNYTGCAWLWLRDGTDREKVRAALAGLQGVEAVRDSEAVAGEYNLDAGAMGDLVVFGDANTMFGDMDLEYERLPPDYRAHGSLHEMDLPLIIYNYRGELPGQDYFTHNRDLLRFLYR